MTAAILITVNIEELRADVREALEAGKPCVTLSYASDDEVDAAKDAMRADGWAVELRRGERDGGVITVFPHNKGISLYVSDELRERALACATVAGCSLPELVRASIHAECERIEKLAGRASR